MLVLKLFQRSIEGMHLPGEQPRSIFANKGFPACIFVEAPSEATVKKLCEGVSYTNPLKVFPVDVLDAVRCLAPSRESYRPHPNSWVRMRKRGYSGDIAYILHVHAETQNVDVVLLPRIQYKVQADEGDPPTTPAAAPLNREKVKKGGETISTVSGRTGAATEYRFRKRRYDASGFWLLRGVESRHYYRAKAQPTLEELVAFSHCVSIPQESLRKHFRSLELRSLRSGTKVKVTLTPDDAKIGTIERVDLDIAYVRLHITEELTSVPVSCVRRHFSPGDRVRVSVGDSKGLVAWVVSVDETSYLVTLHTLETNVCSMLPLSLRHALTLLFRAKSPSPSIA